MDASVDVVKKLATFGKGNQDNLYNPAYFVLKLFAETSKRLHGKVQRSLKRIVGVRKCLRTITWRVCDAQETTAAVVCQQWAQRINNTRYMLRLFKGVTAANAIIHKKYLHEPDRTARQLKLLTTVVDFLFQCFEFPSLLKQISPDAFSFDGGWYNRMAVRCWLFNTFVGIFALWRDYRRSKRTAKNAASRTVSIRRTMVLVCYVCDVLLAYNWQASAPILTELQIGLLGTLCGLLRLFMVWRQV